MSLYNYKGYLSSFIVKKMFIEIGFKEVWVFKSIFFGFLFKIMKKNYDFYGEENIH